MTTWHTQVQLQVLSTAWQKVDVARHTDPRSPLSGVRLHLLQDQLHLTATDDNVRGAICHIPATTGPGFWAVAPASFHADLLTAFTPRDQIRLGTQGTQLIAVGGHDLRLTWACGPDAAFTLGCFAGLGTGWRQIGSDRYWLKGAVRPADELVIEGRSVQQSYDASTIFEEVYDEYPDTDEQHDEISEETLAPAAFAAVMAKRPASLSALATPPTLGKTSAVLRPPAPLSDGLLTATGRAPSRTVQKASAGPVVAKPATTLGKRERRTT